MLTLDERIKNTHQIVLGEVVKVDPLVWNTGDGQPPANMCVTREYYQPEHEQIMPIQVLVRESYKGNLPVGTVLNLNLKGVPGALPGIIPDRFKVAQGETDIWFLNDARGPGWPLTDDPTYYTAIADIFKNDPQIGWSPSGFTSGTFKNPAELRDLIQHPEPTPSPTK